jgi:hypothetical protein
MSDTLSRDITIPLEEFEKNINIDIYDLFEGTLRNFGINNFKLGSYDDMFENFKKLLDKPKYEIAKISMNPKDIYKLNYIRTKSDGTEEKTEFTYIKKLSEGSFNKVEIWTNAKGEEVSLRKSINIFKKPFSEEIKLKIFNSFYENIKHIILYLIIRKYKGNIKIIPKPYYLAIDQDNINLEILMIMEKGDITLKDYMITNQSNMLLIRKQYYTIYKNLTDLQYICNFRHGDLKTNNVILTKNLNPILIDFGFSNFIIKNKDRGLIHFINLDDRFEQLPYYYKLYYNSIHDILQLIASSYSVLGSDCGKIFKFTSNSKSNILDEDNILEIFMILKEAYDINFNDIFRTFYDFNKFNLLEYEETLDVANTIGISPHQLAINLGLDEETSILRELYEKKYLKYKKKYLQLKLTL